jgi:phosphate starvation-inducible PhoH-like protein
LCYSYPIQATQVITKLLKPHYLGHLSLSPIDNRRLADLCGQFDENLRQIESYLGVEINHRGNEFNIIGNEDCVKKANDVLEKLYQDTHIPNNLSLQRVKEMLQDMAQKTPTAEPPVDFTDALVQTRSAVIKPRSLNQYHYLKDIFQYDINFGVGPSGTGKTYLAVACAVAALEKEQVRRIMLVRPAVEAGEKLGFLPGDMEQKIHPYLRPLYDALFEMVGLERVTHYIEHNVIEVAPLAYMRGRTLNEAFIILDEAQNTTKEQMKMFLTRIGFGSKAVITGDMTQTDLPKNIESGLRHAIEVLKDIDEIRFTFFQAQDVVRHPLVQKIVQAYNKYEAK